MARRAAHSPEQLREMIVDAAESIIRRDGLVGLSAREIAKAIGYSPGTLYNAYANLDDILLHVESRVLDSLLVSLRSVPKASSARETVRSKLLAYLAFTQSNPELWNLLFEHRLPTFTPTPPWYRSKIEAVMGELRQAIAPLMPTHDQDRIVATTDVLWASVHGISALATAGKLNTISHSTASSLVDDLLNRYLDGIGAQAAAGKAANGIVAPHGNPIAG